MKRTILVLMIFTSGYLHSSVVCSNFNTQAEAQEYFEKKQQGYKGLDRDKDGIACEGIKYKLNTDKYILKIYNNGVADPAIKKFNSLELCKEGIKKMKSIIKSKDYTFKCIKQ